MKVQLITLLFGMDRDAALLVNDTEIARTNYDECGSAGTDLLESIAEKLAEMANVRVVRGDLED